MTPFGETQADGEGMNAPITYPVAEGRAPGRMIDLVGSTALIVTSEGYRLWLDLKYLRVC